MVPLLGILNELAGTVFVERGNRASSEQAVNQLTQTIKTGRSVLVFPEGTRSVDGTIQAFKKGAFHLAKAGGAHIVPMHIHGTHNRLPPNAWMFKPSNKAIRVRIGAPFSSDGTVDKLLTDARDRVSNWNSDHNEFKGSIPSTMARCASMPFAFLAPPMKIMLG